MPQSAAETDVNLQHSLSSTELSFPSGRSVQHSLPSTELSFPSGRSVPDPDDNSQHLQPSTAPSLCLRESDQGAFDDQWTQLEDAFQTPRSTAETNVSPECSLPSTGSSIPSGQSARDVSDVRHVYVPLVPMEPFKIPPPLNYPELPFQIPQPQIPQPVPETDDMDVVEQHPQSSTPPSCAISRDKIKVLWERTKERTKRSSYTTMIRCLCSYHEKDMLKIYNFYFEILYAVGDVAMTRGNCPMCCISPCKRSERPLVRFTEEIAITEEDDHDWCDFQFRGMLFEMFPSNWVVVENKVFKDKTLVISAKANISLSCLEKRRKELVQCDINTEEVFSSHLLRPWPLYEMAISQSHGERARYLTLQYLDVAFGEVFRNQFREWFIDENQVLKRIMISAAQMIPGGNCLLDDTSESIPHSRSRSHMLGCLVTYRSLGNRVLAEMLRTWDSVEWNGDTASYLTSIFGEEFCEGAFDYYFNSKRSTAVRVEMFQGSLHVTSITYRDEDRMETSM
ncbi:hypothetical protein FGB62_22g819 [Gracilaria domingensis]|nr:hypothetical protein FGB62_22g819 [Gracilaria domingensis]